MFGNGLVVDLFAGGGGASTGLSWALGSDPDIAINHDPEAIALHRANHPATRHFINDVTTVDPLEATGGLPVSVLHASPDCTHFSRAKGGKPRSRRIRDLAWVVVRWAREVRPKLITLENVEEFLGWGPLDASDQPIKALSGQTFRAWVLALEELGYAVEWRLLRACDYGAPTSRRRLFVVARCDGRPILWPAPTHGDPRSPEVARGELLPWRAAAECIDWSIRGRSIFDRTRPLARNTQRRIAEGLRRYVFESGEPFIVSYYGPKTGRDFRGQVLSRPLPTQTTENRFGLIAPVLATNTTGHAPTPVDSPVPTLTTGGQQMLAVAVADAPGKRRAEDDGDLAMSAPFVQHVQHANAGCGTMPANGPLRTITAHPKGGGMAVVDIELRPREDGPESGNDAVCIPFIAKNYTGVVGHDLARPLGAVTTVDHHALASACLVKYYGNERGGIPVDTPIHTITGKDRMGLVTTEMDGEIPRAQKTLEWLREWGIVGPDDEAVVVHNGKAYRVTDIRMRMLAPRELYTAQGFPRDYVIDVPYKGKPLTKTAQVRMCGNSVPPELVCALVSKNAPEPLETLRERKTA